MFKSHFKAGNPFQNIRLRAINRTDTTVTVGQVQILNFNLDAPTVTGGELGGGPGTPTGTGTLAAPIPYPTEDGMFCNIDGPTAPAQSVQQMYVVVTDLLDGAGASNTEVEVCLQGVVTVDAVSAAYTIGQNLMPATNVESTFEVAAYAAGDGNRPVAISMTEATATSLSVIWFGWNGWFCSGNEA